MVQIGGKHFYIFEPTTLKNTVFDPAKRDYTDVVIPIYLFIYKDEIYAKCIVPKFQGTNQFWPNGFNIYIPSDIPYCSSNLISVKTSEFWLTYPEMRLFDGSKYSQACNHKIFGALLLPFLGESSL
jgi:hypothetical protein